MGRFGLSAPTLTALRNLNDTQGAAFVEAEIARLPDVLAVRAVVGDRTELHILAAPGRPAPDVAGDARSIATVNGFEVAVDDVRVVVLDTGGAPAPAPLSRLPHGAERHRVELVDVVVLFEERGARVVATLRSGERSVTGTATCISATASVRRAVADATLTALLELHGTTDQIGVDAALVMSSPPHEFAVALLEMVVPSGEVTLVGTALVRGQGVYDAIGRAVLDATNRRLSRPPEVP